MRWPEDGRQRALTGWIWPGRTMFVISLIDAMFQHFKKSGHVIPFTIDEVALLIGLLHRDEEISKLTLGDIIFSARNIIIFRHGIDELLSNSYLDNDHHYKIRSLYRDLKEAFKVISINGGFILSRVHQLKLIIMYVCKYMKNIILQNKTNWTDSKDWQANMPTYRA
ncbi:hypothetical protein IEQ34_005584 [Dendrobium chrysotoxum]|uniref:Uncharacterized protein n=1 Tax=Dendrobium chrysotoxum TaxID=161865 RepID=A0AAV7H8K1_DENCH|nr:hypothetical protein IEQ34_005584 [Dendrobium chrysotoxum]